MKTFKEYISERISDAEKDDLERRKERHTRQAARNKENLKASQVFNYEIILSKKNDKLDFFLN